MILNYLLIMVVSAIIFALLIPPIQVENARAGEFDENSFPKSSENAPVPYLVGQARINSPNTLFAGEFRSVPITEKVKTGLFSSQNVIVGYQYYVTLDLGLCLGDAIGCTLHEIFIDEESVWTGTVTDDTPFSIDAPDLFGGYKSGGGFSATCRFYPGTFSQNKNAYIDGLASSNGLLPDYKGICHIVFEDAYIGESPQLRKIGFVVSRMTNELGLLSGKEIINTTTVNLAEAIYAGLIDDWGGLSVDPTLIDATNFTAAADTFYNESNGAAGIIFTAKDGKSFVQELLRQGDTILTIDPTTGKMILIPLRHDYTVGSLPIYNENSIISVESFSQTLWPELVSQVKVGYKEESNNYQDATAQDQDLAVAAITGRLKTVQLTMPFVKKGALATQIAGRELNQLSQPTATATLKFKRDAYNLLPGSVFRWAWDDYGITQMVMRVKNVTDGDDLDPSFRVEVVRDPYGDIYTTFATPTPGPTTNITKSPTAVTTYLAMESPEFLIVNAGYTPVAGDPSYLLLLPEPANSASVSVSATVEGFTAFLDKPFPTTGLLVGAIDILDGFAAGELTTVVIDLGTATFPYADSDATGVRNGLNLIVINGEILGFETYTDNLDGTYDLETVHRGLLNTKQASHADGDTIFLLDDFGYVSAAWEDEADTPSAVKFIPSSGVVTMTPASITPINVTIYGGYTRPDPPDYTQVEASRTFDLPDDGASITVDWRARDKSLGSIQLIGDAADTVSGMTYNLYLFDLTTGGGAIHTQLALATSSHTFNLPSGRAGHLMELRVYSVVGGRTSVTFDFYRFTVRPPFEMLLEGDAQSGTDKLLTEGDAQTGTDVLELEGDEA